jgi:hypothetical protein
MVTKADARKFYQQVEAIENALETHEREGDIGEALEAAYDKATELRELLGQALDAKPGGRSDPE